MTNSSYQQLIDDSTKLLFDKSETPRIDAEVLLQHAIQKDMAWIIAHGNEYASTEQIKAFYEIIEQRVNGEPIAYITGHKEFWSLQLKVNQDVLIPRGDTETLVDLALSVIPKQQDANILDLGTGSGAIALAVAKERPQSKVIAVDAHKKALDVAKHNQTLNSIENVEFIQSDWFNSVTESQFDAILSNPPYVAAGDPHLERGDLRFEPNSALIGKGSGFDDLRLIIEQAPNYLKDNAYLIVEHGADQAQQVIDAFKQRGFSKVANHLDINKLPRCCIGQWICQS